MTVLSTHALNVALGGRTVLHDFHVEAQSGQFVCVLGPNGAGKSTLLRALAGLIASPAVMLDGQGLDRLTPQQRGRHLAWLPQTGQAVWPLSVRSIVALGRMPHGATLDNLSPHDDAVIERALVACDIVHLAARDVTTLSGGERARVLLARALAVDAPIVLADEPVSALDPQHQLLVMEALQRQAREGRLVIAVLHDLSLAARFADRILLLKDGRLLADGTPKDVLDAERLRSVFGVEAVTLTHDGVPFVVPISVSQR